MTISMVRCGCHALPARSVRVFRRSARPHPSVALVCDAEHTHKKTATSRTTHRNASAAFAQRDGGTVSALGCAPSKGAISDGADESVVAHPRQRVRRLARPVQPIDPIDSHAHAQGQQSGVRDRADAHIAVRRRRARSRVQAPQHEQPDGVDPAERREPSTRQDEPDLVRAAVALAPTPAADGRHVGLRQPPKVFSGDAIVDRARFVAHVRDHAHGGAV